MRDVMQMRERGYIPLAALSKASVCGRTLPEIVGSNPARGKDVCRECCVSAGRGLCNESIARTVESYLLWHV
jgi:hypothetical protein